MPKDHYISLGISKGADFKKIKKAYRKIIKEVHPDITRSEESVKRFLEIRKAYETLADEEKRRLYDQEHEKQDSDVRVKRGPEFINQRPSIFNELESFFTPAREFLEGFLPGFFDTERVRIRGKNLYFEAILTLSEAQRGGLFPITVPVHERCSKCEGTGYVESFFCSVCSGYGMVDSERGFSLHMPPNIKHGTEITLSIKDIGLKEIFLHVRILIDLYA